MTLNVPNRNTYKNILRYTRRSWDYQNRRNAEVEDSKFEDLSVEVQDALTLTGFTADSHLCCHGHYLPLNWTELSMDVYAGPKAAYELLGYDETNWGVEKTPLPFDGVAWDDLPEEIQIVLNVDLCYNKELWDGVDLAMWTNETTVPGSYLPTVEVDDTEPMATDPDPVLNVTEMVEEIMDMMEMTNETLSPTAAATEMPTVPPATESPTVSPTGSPTASPTATPTKSPTEAPTPSPTPAPTLTPTGTPTMTPTGSPTGTPTLTETEAPIVPEPDVVVTSSSSRSSLALVSSAVTFVYVVVSIM